MTVGDREKGHAGGTPRSGRECASIERHSTLGVGLSAVSSFCGVPLDSRLCTCDTAYYDGVVEGDLYDGIPVDQLPIEAVDVPDPAHLRRSDRYVGAVDIDPEHAIEAVFDPRRLVARDPKSRIGEAIRVLGYSAGMDRVLVVVLVPDSHPPSGLWHVATAWPADSRMCRVYGG